MSRTGGMTASSRRKRSSTMTHTEQQHAVYAAPWMLWFFSGVLVQSLHFFVAAGYGILVIVMVTLAAGLVAAAGYYSTHDRSPVAITHTLATIGISAVFTMYASFFGLFTMKTIWQPTDPTTGESLFSVSMPWPVPETLLIYLVGGVTLCVVWNMRQQRGVREVRHATLFEEPTTPWDDIGLSGIRGTLKRVNPYRSEGVWSLPRGMTVDAVQKSVDAIESAFDYPRGSLTVISHNHSSRKVKATVIHEDPLVNGVAWTGVDE
jgi:hypothetical protein